MICNVCGKELPDDSRFCEVCGSQIDEKIIKKIEKEKKAQQKAIEKEKMKQALSDAKGKALDMAQNVQETSKAVAGQVKEKSKKVNKKPFIIGGIIVAVIAVVIACVLYFVGRDVDKTFESMAQAYEDKDEDKLIKYMFPGNAIEGVQEFLDDNDIDLFEKFEELFGEDADLEDLNIVDEEEVNDDLIADIDSILDEIDVALEYDEIKIIVLSFEDSNEDYSGDVIKVISYKVGRTWYIVPGVLEYVEYLRQEDDIKHGERIATALQTTLGLEVADTAIVPYYDVVISMDDLEYLPQAFSEEFKRCMEDTDYQLRHTEDGAAGYAFKISKSGSVEVYISSDSKMDEWKVYPSVDTDYYEGIKDKVSGTSLSNEYSYVKLISEQSPITGYWQSDKAGMYIGYNVSGGDEGFTVYLQSQEQQIGFQLLHRYEDYTYSGRTGNIKFSKNTDYYNVVYDIQVVDDNTIELTVTNGGYDGTVNTEYTFKKGEIPRDVFDQYEGIWINGGGVYGRYGKYGEMLNYAYCDECNSIHDKDSSVVHYSLEVQDLNFHEDNYISMYDGNVLYVYFLYEGLWDDYEKYARVYNLIVGYTVDGDKLEITGGNQYLASLYYIYYREGSEQAQIAEALNAYQEYVDSSDEIGLFYLNDDNIPEACVVDYTALRIGADIVMSYINGEVFAFDMDITGEIKYQERQNKLCTVENYSPTGYQYETNKFYTLDNTGFVETGYFEYSAKLPPDTGFNYYYNHDEVSGETHNSKLEEAKQNFDWDSASNISTYSSWQEAYNNLKKPIDSSKYDTGSSVAVEEGDTVWVSVETKHVGALEYDWREEGETEFVIVPESPEFNWTEEKLSEEEQREYMNNAIGKGVGDCFELEFSGGSGTIYYRYTILGVKKNK